MAAEQQGPARRDRRALAADASQGVAARLAQVRGRIDAACLRSARSPQSVTLVGVGKNHPASALLEARQAGLLDLGENRVQEARSKAAELPPELRWHLLGPLQSNKVRAAVSLFGTIHSLDRLPIAHAIDREAAASGKTLNGFLEVNLAGEASKHGFAASGLADAVAELAALRSLRIVGLMAMPPFVEDAEETRPWFRALARLRDDLASRTEWRQVHFPGWLSMGMSADYEVAIEEGATHVRVGTAIFGSRAVALG
jgi:PLP dependent protein